MRRDNLFADIVKKNKEFILSYAIDEVENALYTYPKIPGMDELTAIREDFDRMKDYWLKGYPDDNRQQIYDRLMARMQRLTGNVERRIMLYGSMNGGREMQEKIATMENLRIPENIKEKLEHFVTELALVDLLPANKREAKQTELLAEKFYYLEWLYDSILMSPQWSEEDAMKMEELFLSPLIDSFSQQALIPAIILGCCIWFDYRKERMLINVYMKSTDEQVRQRALVGLALAMDSMQYRLADSEHEDPISKLLENERSVKELRDLQLQLAMAQLAERDKDVMEKQIIPNIMNNSPLTFKNGVFEEVEEDSSEDILDPNAADRRRENLESTVKMMQKLYKSGRDIYYGSFMHMKRFPFFDRLINWTLPYTRLNPAVMGLDSRISRILAISAEHSQLCDSDSYSFLLSMKGTMPKMPEAMIDSLNSMTNAPEPDPSVVKPAAIRRNLIQNIYRLIHLSPNRTMFPELFRNVDCYDKEEGLPPFLFLAQPVFADSVLLRKWGVAIAMVLNSRGKEEDARMIIKNYDKMEHSFESACFMADMDLKNAEHHLEEAISFKQDDKVLCRLARCYTKKCKTDKWEKGMKILDELLEKNPNNIDALKVKGFALTDIEESYEEAKALLYRVNYENPNDMVVCSVLGRLLLKMGNAGQACAMFEKVYEHDTSDHPNTISYGISLLACRRFNDAIEALEMEDKTLSLLAIDDKREVLEKCGVTPLEIKLFKASLAEM